MNDSDVATVKREFGDVVRSGRGFSHEELGKAGIDPRFARNFGLPVDKLRRSIHQENVDKLAPFAKQIAEVRSAKKLRPKPEKAAPAKKSVAETSAESGGAKKKFGLRRAKKKAEK